MLRGAGGPGFAGRLSGRATTRREHALRRLHRRRGLRLRGRRGAHASRTHRAGTIRRCVRGRGADVDDRRQCARARPDRRTAGIRRQPPSRHVPARLLSVLGRRLGEHRCRRRHRMAALCGAIGADHRRRCSVRHAGGSNRQCRRPRRRARRAHPTSRRRCPRAAAAQRRRARDQERDVDRHHRRRTALGARRLPLRDRPRRGTAPRLGAVVADVPRAGADRTWRPRSR